MGSSRPDEGTETIIYVLGLSKSSYVDREGKDGRSGGLVPLELELLLWSSMGRENGYQVESGTGYDSLTVKEPLSESCMCNGMR